MEVADHVVVMNEGRVEQKGTPANVYHHPANSFVYRFIGDVNLFHGRMVDGELALDGTSVDTTGHRPSNGSTNVYVRPHSFTIASQPGGENSFRASIQHINPARPLVKLELTSEWGDHVHVDISHELFQELKLEKGMEVYVAPTHFKVFEEKETEEEGS